MDRFGARSLDDAMASIAVPGTDPTAVGEYVIGRLAAHRRRSRMLVALAAVLVLMAGGTAFALSGGEDPEEVVAPAGESADDSVSSDSGSDLSQSGSDTVVTAVPTTAPSTLAVPTTSAPSIEGVASGFPSLPRLPRDSPSPSPAPGTAPPAVPSTATSTPPDAPLTARYSETNPSAPVVGDVVTVRLDWVDPDLPAGTVATARLLGIGEETALLAADGPCTGGTGAGGTITRKIRFTTARRHAVAIELSTCGGNIVPFTTEVEVGSPGRQTPVKVRLPRSVDPEVGTWKFLPEGGGEKVLRDDANGNDPEVVRMFEGDHAVTAVVVPGPGSITHEAADCSRRATLAAGAWELTLGPCS